MTIQYANLFNGSGAGLYDIPGTAVVGFDLLAPKADPTFTGSVVTINTTNGATIGGAAGYLDIRPSASDSTLVLTKPTGAYTAAVYGARGSLIRWQLDLGNATAESGFNFGSDFGISRYSDVGAQIDTPLSISRYSGEVTTGGALKVNGSLTVASKASTTPVSVAFSATPTFNAGSSNVFYFGTMTANVTTMLIANQSDGQTIMIRVVQDATGARTVALPTGAKVSGFMGVAANSVTWLIMTYVQSAARWEGTWSVIPA
jgi:hypothetical protein